MRKQGGSLAGQRAEAEIRKSGPDKDGGSYCPPGKLQTSSTPLVA